MTTITHCQRKGRNEKAAEAFSEESGIVMEVFTDLPGMQFYIGNFIEQEQEKTDAYMVNGAVSVWKHSIIRMPAIRLLFRALY